MIQEITRILRTYSINNSGEFFSGFVDIKLDSVFIDEDVMIALRRLSTILTTQGFKNSRVNKAIHKTCSAHG